MSAAGPGGLPLLRDNPEDLRALVSSAAAHLELDPSFVEKDFWVTEVLRAAAGPRAVVDKMGAGHEVRLIFKGGTSLSKVFGLIQRFSEDVDLLVEFPLYPTSEGRPSWPATRCGIRAACTCG